MFKIDARGKACPLPVIETRKALKEASVVETIVDNKIATENLKKMADQLGYECTIEEQSPTHYTVVISRDGETGVVTADSDEARGIHAPDDSYIVVVTSSMMGTGAEDLGKKLLQTFIYTLTEQDILPEKIIFYNGGVPLVTDDSDSLADLQSLAASGVEVYVCGACLNYYELTERVAVGEITNMFRIVEMMRTAHRIVKP